jgi:hypothetical protein
MQTLAIQWVNHFKVTLVVSGQLLSPLITPKLCQVQRIIPFVSGIQNLDYKHAALSKGILFGLLLLLSLLMENGYCLHLLILQFEHGIYTLVLHSVALSNHTALV